MTPFETGGAEPGVHDDEPAIVVSDLIKVYEPLPGWMKLLTRSASRRRVVALDGVDLVLQRGVICAVVGPNGAGKSTLFRILMGLTTLTSGSAQVLGLDCTVRSDTRRMSIGFMSADERSLLLRLTCHDNLVFQGQLRGYGGTRLLARVDEVMELVGLTAVRDRAAFALSSGMKARLQLGRALVHEPEVLILDEPTATVDPVAAYELLQLIQGLTRKHSLAVLLSSHRLEEIDALDEMVLLLDRGRVVFNGDLRELRELAVLTEVSIEFDEAEAAQRAGRHLDAALSLATVSVSGRSVELTAARQLGDVLSALGDESAHVVHIDQHSGSTRSLLQRLYSAEAPDGAPA